MLAPNGESRQENIAIVGMSCLFPGADSVSRFWHNIVNKVDCITEATPEWQPELFHDPTGEDPDQSYSRTGGFLGSLCRFDPARYGVPPTSVPGAEPDHFIALRCAFEALADAGVPDLPLNREKTGVIVGRGLYVNRGWISAVQRTFVVDEVIRVLRQLEPDRNEKELASIKEELKASLPPMNAETVPGLVHSAMVGRIANRLDLCGPAYTVDAACSSALIAADAGMRELRSGNCDAVLVGGAQVSSPAQIYVIFCKLQALSKAGKIAPFSADAAGTLVGQGCGMLLLKRESDAVRDGNRIYALLKSVGISSDGRRAGILAPHTIGQQMAIRRAYADAGISPASVGLIEAHGTGIPLGDRTEVHSLAQCFAGSGLTPDSVALGSVKSMIGHLLPAAGAAALIKTALALYFRNLPPTLHAENPHPELELSKTPFYICTKPQPWLHGDLDTPRRAGVNAFGFGGINAHAILEEYNGPDEPRFDEEWPAELVVVSAADLRTLTARVQSLGVWVKRAESARLLDIAAACARRPGPCRLAIVATSREDLHRKLVHAGKLLAEPERKQIQDRTGIFWYQRPLALEGRVAFLFPGEGAQYVNMLSDLCRQFPEVRRQFDLTAAALKTRGLDRPLGQLLYPQPAVESASSADLFNLEGAVASVTAAGRGFLALLSRLGVVPDAILGHSSGEFSALLAAGVYQPKNDADAIESIIAGANSARDLESSGLVPKAALLAVGGADPSAVQNAIQASHGKLAIAMDNCPGQVVLAGSTEAIDAAIEALRGKGGLCERLPWDRAYHTDAFAPVCQMIDQFYRCFQFQKPTVELWSCATAGRFPNDPAAIHELAVRQWKSCVRFRETVQAMHDDGIRLFVELGPRGNLSAFVADTLGERPHAAIPMDTYRKGGLEQLCHAVGRLVAHGVDVNLEKLYERRNPQPIDPDGPLPVVEAPQPILPLELPLLNVSPRPRNPQPVATRLEPVTPAPSVTVPQSNGSNGHVSRVPAKPTSASRSSVNDGPLRPMPAPVPVPRDAVRPVDSRTQAIADFQHTMRSFLHVQQDLMVAYRTAQQRTPNGIGPILEASRVTTTPSPRALTDATSSATTAKQPAYRYLERIIEHRPGERLVAESELRIQELRFLLDHTFFGRGISAIDPSLRALPIMPLAMTQELLAEVAARLRPGLHVVALSEIITAEWLAFPEETRRVRLEATCQEGMKTRARLFALDRGPEPVLIAEATVEHSPAPVDLGPPRFTRAQEAPPSWKKDGLYGPILYHGAAFQGIEEVVACGPSGIHARVRVPDPRLLFTDGRASLLLPVVLIDTASQLPALGNVAKDFDTGMATLAFPNSTARMEFLPGRPAQEPLTANVRYEQRDGFLHSDVEMTAADGRVVLRYLGRVEEVVPFPLLPYVYPTNPRERRLSADITSLFQDVPGIEHCTVVDSERLGDRILVKQFWADVVRRMTLSRAEQVAWDANSKPPVAKAGGLIGRIVAKDAVRLRERISLPLADLTIDTLPSGQPVVRAPGIELRSKISLSHKLLYAVAAATTGQAGIGIDVEPAVMLDAGVLEISFNASERALFAGLSFPDTAAWTAKEAIGKALGRGLAGNPNAIELVQAKQTAGGIEFRAVLAGQLATMFPEFSRGGNRAGALVAHCRLHRDHVIALCLLDGIAKWK